MRTCGDCTLCCTLLHVKELEKPAHTECVNCKAGCTIYLQRPKSCRDFECLWLQEESMPEELKPNKSHVVMWVTEDGSILIASVDPNYPTAYREGEMGRLLQSMLEVKDAKVGIIVGDNRFPLLPETTFMEYEESGEIETRIQTL